MLKVVVRFFGGCRFRVFFRGEVLLKCFIVEIIRLVGIGNSCFWIRVFCLFNMEKFSFLWDIFCGSLLGSKNRELMSYGDLNLEV